AGDADDVGHRGGRFAEERVSNGEQRVAGSDVQVEQAREWQIDVLDLVHRQGDVDSSNRLDVLFLEGHRRVRPQARPLVAREADEWAGVGDHSLITVIRPGRDSTELPLPRPHAQDGRLPVTGTGSL